MNCPKCNCVRTKVVVVRYTDSAERVKVRRRKCNACDHRWYTFQGEEKILPTHAIHWVKDAAIHKTERIKIDAC